MEKKVKEGKGGVGGRKRDLSVFSFVFVFVLFTFV